MRFHNLDLNLLQVFKTLNELRSVTRTAQHLKLTQPSLSNALARLRAHFEDELFILEDGLMQPTPFARGLSPQVDELLTRLEGVATARAHFDARTSAREFRFTASDQAYATVILPLLASLAHCAPHLRVDTSSSADQGGEFLRRGLVDFIINPEWNRFAAHPSVPLLEDDTVCVLRAGHPAAQQGLTVDALCQLQQVDTKLRPGPGPIDRELAKLGRERRVSAWAPNFALMIDTVAATDLAACIARRYAQYVAPKYQLVLRELPIPVERSRILLQWNATREHDAGIAWMKQLLQDVLR